MTFPDDGQEHLVLLGRATLWDIHPVLGRTTAPTSAPPGCRCSSLPRPLPRELVEQRARQGGSQHDRQGYLQMVAAQ
ncbi:MAG: hypothetical protein ACRDZ8_19480 [Acidimicrobiales bacterium]